MRFSDQTDKLIPALLAVQAKLRPLVKDGHNTDIGNRYVKLDAMVDAVRPVLSEAQLVLVQGSDDSAPPKIVRELTRLIHTSGQWVETSTEVPLLGRLISKANGGGRQDPDAQAAGSAITYARRYGLASILGLTSDEDDDGNRASRGARRQRGFIDAPEPVAGAGPAAAKVFDPTLMPVGQHWLHKPIKDVPISTLRGALQHCRDNHLKEQSRIIAAELTRRALGGDHAAEGALRKVASQDEGLALELDEARVRAEQDREAEGTEAAAPAAPTTPAGKANGARAAR